MKQTIQEYNLYQKIKAVPTESESDTLYITGLANSGQVDRVGDKLTEEALTQIAEQLPTVNLHFDHGETINDIVGTFTNAKVTKNGVEFKARILNEKKNLIKNLLDQGVQLGASISGLCEYDNGSDQDIINWDLTEVSLTDIPCDPQTMGTVQQAKSLNNVLNNIRKQIEEDNMANEENGITKDEVIQIVNDALNEQQEVLVETIKEDLKTELVTKEDLKELLDTIKEDKPSDNTEEQEKAETTDDEDKEEEQKADTEENKEDEEKTDDDEDKEEEEQKAFKEAVNKAVDIKIRSIFKGLNKEVDTKYNANKAQKTTKQETKKSYTAKELAEMF